MRQTRSDDDDDNDAEGDDDDDDEGCNHGHWTRTHQTGSDEDERNVYNCVVAVVQTKCERSKFGKHHQWPGGSNEADKQAQTD